MWLLVFLSLSLGIQAHSDVQPPPSLAKQATEQARYYLDNIKESDSKNNAMSLWSLATLCENDTHSQLKAFINEEASEIDFLKDLEEPFCNGESTTDHLTKLAFRLSSPNLLLASILKIDDPEKKRQLYKDYKQRNTINRTESINFDKLFSAVLAKDSLDASILPTDTFHFAHFLLFFNEDILSDNIITPFYRQKIADTWYQQNIAFDNSSLGNSFSLLTLFRALFLSNDYSEINDLHSELKREKLFPLSKFKIQIQRFWIFSMYRLGFYDKGLDILRDYTIPLSKYLELEQRELTLSITQGIYLYQIGKIQQAEEIYQEVLNKSRKNDISVNESSLYYNLGITYFKTGNFDKYLDLQFQALELAKSRDNYSHQFQILQSLHIFYRRSGDKESALRYIEQALELAKRHNNIEHLGSVYTSLGVFYRDLKSKPDSAGIYFDKAQKVFENKDLFIKSIILLREKAKLEEKQKNYTKALQLYRKIQKIALLKENTQIYLDTRVDEARIQLSLGKLDTVDKILIELENSDLSLLDFSEIIKAKVLEAKYAVKIGEYDAAYQILEPVINQIVERSKSSTDLKSGFWSVEQEYINAFEVFVNLLIETNRPRDAVLALDRLKTINDASLYQDPMVKSTHLNESELTQYRSLTNRLDRLRKQQLSASGERRDKIQNRIDRLNAQKRSLDRKITQYSDQPDPEIYEIQRQLSSRDLILHITELKDTYYLAKVSRRNVSIQKIELDESTRFLFENSIQKLANGQTDLHNLYQISEKLNIADLPASTENIILIPDSYLFQLPLDILPTTRPDKNYSYGEPTYLIEKYKTEYLTSLNELVYNPEADKSFDWDYVGFGISNFSANSNLMPLPYASREVTEISRQLNNLDNHRTILGDNSTEEAFRKAAPEARILHLATHSKVFEQDPLFSTIYMSNPGDTTEQGQFNSQIFAYELFDMNLSNDMVMLNSCESGSGSYLQGSGIVGISRALRYAGAESLVLNLWSVNDMMASDFAIQFYKALNQGSTKPEALRKAKVHFLKQKNANPHYWGPYMLIGNSQPIVRPHRRANLMVASVFMFYLILMVGLSYRIQQKNGDSMSAS